MSSSLEGAFEEAAVPSIGRKKRKLEFNELRMKYIGWKPLDGFCGICERYGTCFSVVMYFQNRSERNIVCVLEPDRLFRGG